MRYYDKKFGSYYLMEGDRILFMTDRVAVAYDNEDGTLLKHGDPVTVNAYAVKLRAANQKLFKDVRVIESDAFLVEDLNRCLTHSGYVKQLAARIVQRGH